MASVVNQEEEEAMLDAVLVMSTSVLPMVLNRAIELDLFGFIARAGNGGSLSASEIASQLPAAQNPEMLDHMMHLFATHTCFFLFDNFGEWQNRESLLKPVCKLLLPDNNQHGNLAPMAALNRHPTGFEVWLHMKDAILEGGNLFEKVHGMTVFLYMKKRPT